MSWSLHTCFPLPFMKPDTGFVYYTLSSSHYKVPEMMTLSFGELPSIPFPTSIEMAKEDQTILRDWGDNFGNPVHQLTVRNQSTKDNIGTLPIFAYTTPDPPQQPLNFSAMVDQTPRLARIESIAPSGAACGGILFQENSVLIVKCDHIRRQSRVATSGPFFIGSLETDVTEDDHESYFDLQFCVPSFQDCLNFIHHRKVNVHRDAVICTIDETEIQTGYCFTKLSQETYETLLSELHDIKDLLPEGEGYEEASEEESDKECNSNVLVAARPLGTLCGRMVFRPNRLDL